MKTQEMPVSGVSVITGHAELVFDNQLTAQTSTNIDIFFLITLLLLMLSFRDVYFWKDN